MNENLKRSMQFQKTKKVWKQTELRHLKLVIRSNSIFLKESDL